VAVIPFPALPPPVQVDSVGVPVHEPAPAIAKPPRSSTMPGGIVETTIPLVSAGTLRWRVRG